MGSSLAVLYRTAFRAFFSLPFATPPPPPIHFSLFWRKIMKLKPLDYINCSLSVSSIFGAKLEQLQQKKLKFLVHSTKTSSLPFIHTCKYIHFICACIYISYHLKDHIFLSEQSRGFLASQFSFHRREIFCRDLHLADNFS